MTRLTSQSQSDCRWSAARIGDPDGPVLAVFVHGGFWRSQFSADWIAELAQACGELGYAVWNLEYPRVGMPGGGWPGTALAVRDALGAAIAEAGGRAVAVVGHSAGGHLALWAAGEQPPALVVSLAGVADLTTAAREGIGERAVTAFIGADPDDDPDAYRAADPIQRLPLGVAQLLVHGDADDRVPVRQSRSFAAAARAAGDRCELHELAGAGHFDLIAPGGPAWPIVAARLRELAAAPDHA